MNFKRIFGRRSEDSDLAQELESHLAHEIDDNLARGMTPDEARRQAYVRLGNPLRIRDRVWEANRLAGIEDLGRDLRYAARMLRRAPSFTCVALLVMALGIGANTAIYSFLDSLLLRALPVSDPASLVVINWHAPTWRGDFVLQSMSGNIDDDPKLGSVSGIFPYDALGVFQSNSKVFSDVFAYAHTRGVRTINVSIKGQAEVAGGELVSGDYFNGLRVVPAAGRLIGPDDDRVGAPPVAAVSYAYSEKHFGGAAAAAGQNVLINNQPFTIVGVAPPEFFGVDPSAAPEIYAPIQTNLLLEANDPFGFKASDYLDDHYYWMEAMARLRPGVTMAQAQAELGPKFHQWVAATAKTDEQRSKLPEIVLRAGAGGLDTLRREYSKPLYLLMTLVGLILAIACSNVANLLLARATSRRREIALRLSEGASRAQIIRQLLTESVLLAVLGGALGTLLAVWGIRLLDTLLAQSGGEVLHAELNWHVLALTAALALVTGVLFGLVPALQLTRVDLVSALKETRAGQLGARPQRSVWRVSVRQVLVVGQIAASLLMLVAAGLFVRTLSNLQAVSLGFNRENLLLFRLNAPQAGLKDAEVLDFYRRVREQLAAMPGVQSAGLARDSLLSGEDSIPISTVGAAPNGHICYLQVGPDFLKTMQIPILEGRDINEHDRPGSQPVAVISEELARESFPGRNPVGQHLQVWKEIQQKHLAREMEIVGVAKNARYGSLKQITLPIVYMAYDQGFPNPDEMMMALRTLGDPLSYSNQIRDVVHRVDTRVPVSEVRTQKAEIADNMYEETLMAELCSAFAMLALTIACVGLYGTISYAVARRTGEIGIRMALGARRGPVVWMVLREVVVLLAVGLAISVPVAIGTSKFVGSLLFAMKPNDPRALAGAVMILVAAALVAGCVPARRAAHIDPMTALRHE